MAFRTVNANFSSLTGRAASHAGGENSHRSSVLPVGISPVTAVPTRIAHAPAPGLEVSFADRSAVSLALDRLHEFVTEQENPGNAKHVTRIVVELPARRLREGVVFVDTPGLGSLAASGAAQTLAYLPRCDLGVVLVDAASTLTTEDLSTIRALYDAGISASVLLSKADLLAPADRARAASYIEEHIRAELGLSLGVHAVSVIEGWSETLDRWFLDEIGPLTERQQESARASIRRKIGALGEAVRAALRVRLDRASRPRETDAGDLAAVEADLRRAGGMLEEARVAGENLAARIPSLAASILNQAADRLLRGQEDSGGTSSDGATAVAAAFQALAGGRALEIRDELLRAAGAATRALDRAATALEMADAPAGDELAPEVRELPVVPLSVSPFSLRRPLLGAVSTHLAVGLLERQLRARTGGPLADALSMHEQMVSAWVRETVLRLQARFGERADAYRAQIERLGAADRQGASEVEAAGRDLEEISALLSAPETAVATNGIVGQPGRYPPR